jgi:hypothetical protein
MEVTQMKCLLVSLLGLCLAAAHADIVVPGADGSDGAFNPTSNYEVDLSLAPDGTWNGTNQSPTHGVYDPEKWAVVFRYASVNIPSNVTVTFKNHPSRAPVVWLVTGNATIAGIVNLDGKCDGTMAIQEAGPGGFRGGRGHGGAANPGSGGFGPGGGRFVGYGGCGSYGTLGAANSGPVYGNPRVLPMLGGSGGSAYSGSNIGGTAGGGGILIVATGSVSLTGGTSKGVFARGANGGNYAETGSGGAIRIVADTATGNGLLRANALTSAGGVGRIRVEANTVSLSDPGDPAYTTGLPGSTAVVWPDATVPAVQVVSVGAASVPVDPRASFDFPLADVSLADPAAQTVVLEARNVPIGPNPPRWNVVVRVAPKSGQDFTVNATYVSGDTNLSTWYAHVTLPNGFSAIQVRAYAP